jgi:hypothetical protein
LSHLPNNESIRGDLLFQLYLEQKLSGFGGVVSILGDPPAKLKTIDYYPVINTHITDNKASRECSRYSEDGSKDVGQIISPTTST